MMISWLMFVDENMTLYQFHRKTEVKIVHLKCWMSHAVGGTALYRVVPEVLDCPVQRWTVLQIKIQHLMPRPLQ